MSDPISSFATSAWLPRLRQALVIALTIALALIAARGIWLSIDPAGTVSESAPLPRYADSSAAGGTMPADMGLLTSTNPFGGGQEIAAVDLVPDAPETALNLRLIGSRAETNEGGGTATIVTPDNDVQVFSPGDELLSGVVLETVLTDQVLLRRNGALESLRREGRDEGFAVLRKEGDLEEDAGEADTARAPDEAKPSPAPTAKSEGEEVDERALLQSIRIEPELENGNVTGYRLTPRDDGALMADAGLLPGDVLIGFDGQDIADIAQEDVANKLAAGGVARLNIRRDSETIDVDVTLRR